MLIFRGVVKVDKFVTCVLIRVVARIPMIEGKKNIQQLWCFGGQNAKAMKFSQ